MMKKLFFLLTALAIFTGLRGEEKTGTLIVTYQTAPASDRLGRVRFWLRDPEQAQTLYPRGNAYVEDSDEQSRMVVIENLAPGNYELEFLVPNCDGYFQQAPIRDFAIDSGEVVKINHTFKPSPLPLSTQESILFPFLQDNASPIQEEPYSQEPAEKPTGTLIITYTMRKEQENGSRIKVILRDDEGHDLEYPQGEEDLIEDPASGSWLIIASDLPTGCYTLDCYFEDSERPLHSRQVSVDKNKAKSIQFNLDEQQDPA